MKITIVHYYKSVVEGVMTSMIDLYFNLRKYFDVEFIILCPELFSLDHNDEYNLHISETKFFKNEKEIGIDEFLLDKNNEVTCSIPFLKYNKNFGDPKLFFSILINKPILLDADIVICSARLLYEKLMGRLNINFCLSKKNLFILDSLDSHKSNVKATPNINMAIPKNLNKYIFFSNPSNIVKRKKSIEYYHKLSKERLDTLPDIGMLNDSMNYRRKDKSKIKVKDYFFENINKSIFEHLYFGKEVNYYTDGLTVKDGLYYYLKLFGIDASKDHLPLRISKDEIEEKLFMNEDDEIIKEIRRLL